MATPEDREKLSNIIEYMKATEESSWCVNVVSTAGNTNCFFGHLSDMDNTRYAYGELWNWFENTWGTTFYVYPINDGDNTKYQQATPKQRVVAYLENLLSGEEECMEDYWNRMPEMLELYRENYEL